MSNKKQVNENRKDKLRSELDGLLKGFNDTFDNPKADKSDTIIDKKLDALAATERTPSVDFDELDKKFKAKAKNVIASMYDFYKDFGIIDESEYIKVKQDLDASNVSNILFQLKAVKTAIKAIMDEITSGNTHPRIFEALSSLNSQFSDTIKAQANYILFLEDSTKKSIMENAESNGKNAVADVEKEISRESDYYVTSSVKNLIKEIGETNPADTDDTEDMPEIGYTLVNPDQKENLKSELDIPTEKEVDRPDDYDDITSII